MDAIKLTVWQNPLHVRTKGIVTGFVRAVMPCAEDIVLEWLKFTSEVLKLQPNDPLLPKTLVACNPATMSFEAQGLSKEHWANTQPVRDIFKRAFQTVNVPYFNPHLFRNTVCKRALKNCSQYQYKTLSQNFGHDNVMTTYNAYGNLTEDEQLEAVSSISLANLDLQVIRRMGK